MSHPDIVFELRAQLAHERDVNETLRALRANDKDCLAMLEIEVTRLRGTVDRCASEKLAYFEHISRRASPESDFAVLAPS